MSILNKKDNLNNNNNYYPHIDGLRALAIAFVFLNHIGATYFDGGFVGVDVFFVISGYLITLGLTREINKFGSINYFNFILKRSKRILPPLYFALLISLIFAILFLNPSKFIFFSGALASASIAVSNIFFASHAGYFDIFSKSNPLLHTWSLGVEEQFYLIFPILFFLSFKYFKKYTFYFFVVLVFLSLGACYSLDSSKNYYLLPFRFFEFVIGGALVLSGGNNKTKQFIKELFLVFGVFLVVYAAVNINSSDKFPGFLTLIPAIGTALIIRFGGDARLGGFLKNKIIVSFGKISYSFYLFHWIVIVFYKEIKLGFGGDKEIDLYASAFIFLITLMFSIISYNFIEKKFKVLDLEIFNNKKKFISVALLVSVFLVAIGLTGYKTNGWLWRTVDYNSNSVYSDNKSYHLDNWGGAEYNGGNIHQVVSADARIVMLGDSFSGMLNEGVVKVIAEPENIDVFTASGGGAGKYSSALMLPGTYKKRYGEENSKYTNMAISEVKDNLMSIDNSILIYSSSYSGHLLDTSDIDTGSIWGIKFNKITEINDLTPLFQSFEKLLNEFSGKKIVVVGEFPTPVKYRVENCLNQLRIYSGFGCDAYEDKSSNEKAILFNQYLKTYFLDKEALFIDPFEYLCSNESCVNLTDNGFPIYSDNSHLSKHGSIYFIKLIKDEFNRYFNN